MADLAITDLTAISSPASGDKIEIVDISDTTDSASGSSRQITYANLVGGVLSELGVTTSIAELNFVDGVTSAIQTQINTKSPTDSPTFTGNVTLPKTLEIQDTSADHQYILAVSELSADRTVTLPLLTSADEFVFKGHTQTLTNKTLTSPVLTTPQINDTSLDHQYIVAPSELSADRTVTLPLLTGNDEFVFKDFIQTLTNKTLTSPTVNTPTISTPVIKNWDGWIDAGETWTYASATTITVPSGAASKYVIGDKIKLTQTTAKYFYITGVADTTLTITGGSSYTLTNAAISSNYYSHSDNAVGFPPLGVSLTVASWSTSGTAFTNAPSVVSLYMKISGRKCTLWGTFLTNATSGGTGTFYATLTSGQRPTSLDGYPGTVYNFIQNGWVSCGTANRIDIAKYDGTAIAGNNQYFLINISFPF